jgi:hypothetical protein
MSCWWSRLLVGAILADAWPGRALAGMILASLEAMGRPGPNGSVLRLVCRHGGFRMHDC